MDIKPIQNMPKPSYPVLAAAALVTTLALSACRQQSQEVMGGIPPVNPVKGK